MEKRTESDRIFRFNEDRQLYAVDFERNVYNGTMEEALELSKTEMFQLKRSEETESYFKDTNAAFCLFGEGAPINFLGKQDVTQNLFILDSQNITEMNRYDVLSNLQELLNDHYYGTDRGEDDIMEAFGNFSENGSSDTAEILYEKGEGKNVIVHIDVEDATRFLILVNEKGIVEDVELMN